ncbi:MULTISPECIES: hypothetical protein [Silvimonas]|uniref:hypothetical protein n=1 Tax=Silvimonas TaxID=300264 RepID=UPI0024B33A2A|nr:MULTISPECIES: hypothetical protein [Silvimonas]MDR3426967.1 hypothetical protein [Silvimonas sp.]
MKKHISLSALVLSAAFTIQAAPAFSADAASTVIGSGAMSVAYAPVLSVTGHPFEASAAAGGGSAMIVAGLVIGTGDVIEVSVQKVADGSKATVAVSADVVKKLGVAVGQTVTAVSEATGYSLIYSGQILAFVPNAAGQSLLEHSRVSDASAPAAAAGH